MYFPNLGKRLRGVDPTNLLDEDWMEKGGACLLPTTCLFAVSFVATTYQYVQETQRDNNRAVLLVKRSYFPE